MESNETINIDNKKHIEKIYIDKSLNLLKICIGISIFSNLTYVISIFLYQSFDFGFIFEIISFVLMIISYLKIEKNNVPAGKTYIIIAMIPIGWLIIYDFIDLLIHIKEVLIEVSNYFLSFDSYFYYLEPYLFDVTLVLSIILLYKSYSSLCKSQNDSSSKNYIDTFYDTL